VQAIEEMRTDAIVESGGTQRTRPGLQIVIHTLGGESRVVCGPSQTPMIDVTPESAPIEER
jgi:hypothetical protein